MNKTMKTERKIMMIEPLGDGGIAHYSFNLLNALIKRGEQTQLFTAKNYEFENDKLTTFEVSNKMFRIVSYLIKKNSWIDKETRVPSIVRRIVKLIEYPINVVELLLEKIFKQIDIVHFQSVNLIELIAVIGSRIIGARVVFTIHNVMPRHQKLYFYHKFLYRIMYSLCNEIIIHSEKGKEEIIDFYKVSHQKINVIHHGDYKFFIPEKQVSKAEAKSTLGIAEKSKTILFFGAIRENKGLKNILLALPFIKKRIPDLKLMIVGEPLENYNSYKEIIIEQKIQNEVFEKLDYVPNDDVALYFFAADIVVLPYNEITQSGILQIAYAFGKPVVATDLGGFREAIEDDQNGYLVPLDDVKKLGERCVEILIDKDKLHRMGEYSRFLSDTKYSWDSIADKTIEVYKKCLAK
jgi:D-inositol-3-phosphate glycosyltransferase